MKTALPVSSRRVMLTQSPYAHLDPGLAWLAKGTWPCAWIRLPGAPALPLVAAYRCGFELPAAVSLTLHVSADERYELFLDGVRLGRGPERGDPEYWFFESYAVDLAAGPHVLVARVWSLGDLAPYAQTSLGPGFLLGTGNPAQDAWLATGLAPWEGKALSGYSFVRPRLTWGTGAQEVLDGAALDWGVETGAGTGWGGVEKAEPGYTRWPVLDWPAGRWHRLRPAILPAMRSETAPAGTVRHLEALAVCGAENLPIVPAADLPAEHAAWQAWLQGRPLTLAPHTCRRAIVDLGDYRCAYPHLTVSGGRGAQVQLHWAEAAYLEATGGAKGNRDELAHKFFLGAGDRFLPDGGAGREFATRWWRAGRYLEIQVATEAAALTLEALVLEETGYPLAPESSFAAGDPRFAGTIAPMLRALRMCMHETYVDCPYYEQMMYVGDTRLEVLTTYSLTLDDRLPRKALTMFDVSRRVTGCGLTASRYPVRMAQVIPPFSLWWVAMVDDFARWRDDAAFVRERLPGVRGVLDAFAGWIDPDDGLLHAPPGWNFVDWTLSWRAWNRPQAPTSGMPPQADRGASGILNLHLAYTLARVAGLEEAAGEPELAARARRRACELAVRIDQAFWDEERGLYADTVAHDSYSEHAQCLALLSGLFPEARCRRAGAGLLADPRLERTTIYFAHYLFETYRELGASEALWRRLELWFGLEAQGFRTTPEEPEPSRSDCHAWGAHPLYHYYATILGLRPDGYGFRAVRIQPLLGDLPWARGEMVHPAGHIAVEFRRDSGAWNWAVSLPAGLTGTLVLSGQEFSLNPGANAGRVSA